MLGRAANFQARADAARAAVQSMERLEQAKSDLEDCKKGKMALRDRVGVVLADKGMKSTVNECVHATERLSPGPGPGPSRAPGRSDKGRKARALQLMRPPPGHACRLPLPALL